MKHKLIFLALILVGFYLLRKPLTALYLKRQSGIQAVKDAVTLNGYTTYNNSIYTPPAWKPSLSFFRAGSYVPTGQGPATGTNQVDYSYQG